MAVTKESFESSIQKLLEAKARNSSKGKPIIDWFEENFDCSARVAHITEDKQLGNRIKEQFSYEAAIVVFVCEPEVNIESLMRFVGQQAYPNLQTIFIIVANSTLSYSYLHLYSSSSSAFTDWANSNLNVSNEDATWDNTTISAKVLEPGIANYITQHDNESLSKEDIVELFKSLHKKSTRGSRVPDTNMFGILYSPHISKLSIPSKGEGSIASLALESEGSFSDELSRGVAIGAILREHLSISHPSNRLSSNSDQMDKYLRALRTKPFLLLAGISGTGKSRIVREFAFKSCPDSLRDKDGTTPGNFLMIEVKPNWHDSSEILGYYSNIAKTYQFTRFIHFVVKAFKNPEIPFFVCLDEMNLAPVEQYFAEFLSVLETRKTVSGKIKSGVLVEGKYMKDLPEWGKEEALTLPDNLFIVGTVNMDDTTHQFSRKVIDRAMTIEMNGGRLRDMFGGSSRLEYLPDSDNWKLNSFKPLYVTADEALSAHPAEAETMKVNLAERLSIVNDILEGTPYKVSYRVLNELCIYASILLDDNKTLDEALNEAFDQIILMKVLPRIEGDEDVFSIKGSSDNRLDKLMSLFSTESASWKKLKEMNDRLHNGGGFTRFWP